MTPTRSPYVAALIAAVLAVLVVTLLRLPAPFPGASLVFAGLLAVLFTLTLVAWFPVHWIWSDQERLTHAFKVRHGVGVATAESALSAITQSHARATLLRRAADGFQDDVRARTERAADRLDAAAREVFYDPARLSALRPLILRSELIEDAALSHRALRSRSKKAETDASVAASREKLTRGLDAMEAAFEASDLSAKRGLLEKVEVASGVAETLLKPRKSLNVFPDAEDER